MIVFTRHAKRKFSVLKRHDFYISKDQVLKTIKQPDYVDQSRLNMIIAQRKIDSNHVLRVVYKQENGDQKIITFYPGPRSRYEE